VIPYITDEIKRRIRQSLAKDTQIGIIEIGGTVGDIESIPFLEAARQFMYEVGKDNVLFIHLTLIPKINAADEFKTKPTQHSVQKLREIGIQPDIILCRIDGSMDILMKRKIALFTNVEEDSVIEASTIKSSIYEIPLLYHNQGFTKLILKKLKLLNDNEELKIDLSIWEDLVYKIKNPKTKVRIAVVGKYVDLQDAYKSIYEALNHAAIANESKIEIVKIKSDHLTKENVSSMLSDIDGILVPGGFDERGIEGMIIAANFARENKIPYFGICLGMQIMVIEYARNVLGYKEANSTEFDATTPYPVISMLEEQIGVSAKGGTMRLGAIESRVFLNTHIYEAYKSEKISERHRHRYEFNNIYREEFKKNGLIIASITEEVDLIEAVEWPDHPFGVGVQFHPEFKSKPFSPSPIFVEFIKKSILNKK